MTAHEDLSIVLIQGTLVVTNSWHVLDDDGVIWVLAWLVENRVGLNHVIDDIGLGDLLGAELLLGTEVLAIVVPKVVVAGNGSELDTSADQEVDQGRLHLSLARLEVITTNEGVVALSELNATWDECVLWGAVDEWSTLEDTGNSEDSGWGNLLVSVLNGLHEVVGSIIDTSDQLSKALGVGSPLNDDLVESIVGLEVTFEKLADVRGRLIIEGEGISGQLESEGVHTECPCGFSQGAQGKPCYLGECCRHGPLGWQQ